MMQTNSTISKSTLRLGQAALLAGLAALSTPATATVYSQYDIIAANNTLGGTYTRLRAINENGLAVGFMNTGTNHMRGAFYTVNFSVPLPFVQSVGTVSPLSGGNNAALYGVNDNGQMVGYREKFYSLQNEQKMVGYVRDIPGNWWNIPNFSAADQFESVGYDINNNGVVTGFATGFAGTNNSRGFRYDTASQNPVTSSIGVLANGNFGVSYGQGINNFGTVVGYSQNVSAQNRAIRAGSNTITDLGAYPLFLFEDPYPTIATCLNDAVTIGGYSQIDFNTNRAIYRTAFMGIGSWNGVPLLTGAGSDPNDDSNAIYGVNKWGDFVGGSEIGNTNNRAFLYRNDGANYTLHNLNTFISPGSGWVLNTAFDINDRGWIVGEGTLNGVQRGFILYPYSILNGQVTSPGWNPSSFNTRLMNFTIKDATTDAVLQTGTVMLNATGNFTMRSNFCQNVKILFQVDGPFLKKSVTVDATNNTTVNVAVVSGDADGDNEITNADYSIWAFANGSFVTPGSNGDFDGDGEVTNADYSVWAFNNGTLGDE
ncbi:MAG TPA: hypothetical protein PLO61_02200 [Fimbriimonadaceae bacterium]|nr:hypothetical protein [Fimbriimonadaceae bacterium]HRJ32340.1 hypothetical protein [Fimbriimonadaceae bacterium]